MKKYEIPEIAFWEFEADSIVVTSLNSEVKPTNPEDIPTVNPFG